ncbi:MAG: hypothetical protein EOM80_01230 [Erysipelotrichia bacterium]|nr:hypothetical protein [Erysipelotrichia bacterium]
MKKNLAVRFLRSRLSMSLVAVMMASPSVLCAASAEKKELHEIVKNDSALLKKQTESVLSFSASEVYGFSEMADAASALLDSRVAEENTAFVVMGEVNCPGEFELGGRVNLLAAVLAAGGPKVSGSMRRVEVFAGGKSLGEFDLYDFIRQTAPGNDFVFNGGESILVHLAGPRAKITGAVSHPAVYEFRPEEMTLGQVVAMAGGFSDPAAVHKLEILRFVNGSRRVFFGAEVGVNEKILELPVLADDEINVTKLEADRQGYVTLEGLGSPQRFVCSRELQLSDVLKEFSDHEKVALEYAEILREGSANGEYDVLNFSPAAVLGGDKKRDIFLRPGDRVVLFAREWIEKVAPVSVEGLVDKPSTLSFEPDMTVKSVVEACGGIQANGFSEADLFRRELVDGQLKFSHMEINLKLAMEDDPRHNIKLQPFDSLFVGGYGD